MISPLSWPRCWGQGCSAEFCSLMSSPWAVRAPTPRPRSSAPRLSLLPHTSMASLPPCSAPSLPCPTVRWRSRPPWPFCVFRALPLLQVVLLVYHWSSRESEHDLLVHKAVAKWTAEEVVLWLEQLGPWASLYRDRFLAERVNGRWEARYSDILF